MDYGEFLKKNPRGFAKGSKYHNKKTEYNGRVFDSKREAQHCMLLDSLKNAKEEKERVLSYETQIPFQVELNGKKICRYVADFVVKYADGRTEVQDVKGMKTDVYRLKKKLVEAQYGIEIVEI